MIRPGGDSFAETGDLPPGMQIGEYILEHKLGVGGMGTVYGASHPLIGKKAAIKVISPALCKDQEALERFVLEARAVNQIRHPNIIDIFSFGNLPDGRSYFVMEWLDGETLADRIVRAQMGFEEAVNLLDQMADALEAAHEKGVIHRDLKPDNVFLQRTRGKRQIVKLLDFGIAKLGGTAEAGVHRTRTGMVMGTPAYLSPEQARGKGVDHRTDIYSLGCIAFEMLTGRLPFEIESAMEIIAAHLHTPPPTVRSFRPDVPASLDALVAQMLEKDPALRPTLEQMRERLHDTGGPSGELSFDPLPPVDGELPALDLELAPVGSSPVWSDPLPAPPTPAPVDPVAPAPLELVPLDAAPIELAPSPEPAPPDPAPPQPALSPPPAAPKPVPIDPRALSGPVVTFQGGDAFKPPPVEDRALQLEHRPRPGGRVSGQMPAVSSRGHVAPPVSTPLRVPWKAIIAILAIPIVVWKGYRYAEDRWFKHDVVPPPIVVEEPVDSAPPPVPVRPAPEALAAIEVHVNVPNARISVDGQVIAEAAGNVLVPLHRVGLHIVDVSAPRHKKVRKEVMVAAGETRKVDVKLRRSPQAPE